jgi:hypothetical protein
MIPATTDRVILNTPQRHNEDIDDRTRASVARYAAASPQLLDERLRELDHEWDVERTTATGAGMLLLAGVLLASTVDMRWLVLPAIVGACLLLHGLIGWSPVLSLMRRLGYRTPREIDHERYALKALRGDFTPLAVVTTPQDREDLARFEGEGGPPSEDVSSGAIDPQVINDALQAARR